MNLTTLKDLERRLVEALGADRALDYAIHEAVNGDWLRKHGYTRDGDGWRSATPPIKGGEQVCGPEYYTASLDAALGLCERLLPGWRWSSTSESNNDRTKAVGSVSYASGGMAEPYYWGEAPAPALALVLATVRALIAKEEGK